MKTLGTMALLLVVLGFCLPAHGEILVYKFSQSGTYYSQDNGEWRLDPATDKGYIIVEMDYAGGKITDATLIFYWTDKHGKSYVDSGQDLELVRVDMGARVQWILMGKDSQSDGQEVTRYVLIMLTGLARDRGIGTAEKREAANKLSGYGLSDTRDETERDIGKTTFSATLYPAWTYWANGDEEDEGGQDFEAVKRMILDYLEAKGYSPEE